MQSCVADCIERCTTGAAVCCVLPVSNDEVQKQWQIRSVVESNRATKWLNCLVWSCSAPGWREFCCGMAYRMFFIWYRRWPLLNVAEEHLRRWWQVVHQGKILLITAFPHTLLDSETVSQTYRFYNKYYGQSKRYNWHLANVSITTVIIFSA